MSLSGHDVLFLKWISSSCYLDDNTGSICCTLSWLELSSHSHRHNALVSHMNVCPANEDALGTLESWSQCWGCQECNYSNAGNFSRSDSVCKIQEQRFNLQSRYMSQVISTNNNDSFRSPNSRIIYKGRLVTSHYLDCPTFQPRSREHDVQPSRQGSMQKKELGKAQFLACSSTAPDSPHSCSGAAPVWLCHETASFIRLYYCHYMPFKRPPKPLNWVI